MRLLYGVITFLIYQTSLSQQGLYITTEGYLKNENSIITVVNGDFVSSSTTVLNGGTLQMKGLDDNIYHIELSNTNTLDYLELYGTSTIDLDGELVLNREVMLTDTTNLELLTNSVITLAQDAEIVGESNTNTITGADGTYIVTSRVHTAGETNDFGLIGVEVSNGSASMGSTEVYRRYGNFDIDGNPTVSRYYEINPTVNTDLNLDARFNLQDVDLNGLTGSDLAALRSTDNGVTFTNEGGTAGTNFHSVTNLDAFSIWTFAHASTLSINTSGLAHSVSIFPNPANHHVSITSQFGNVVYAIELFDISGQKIVAPVLKNNTFDIGNLSDGVYFIQIQSQNGTVTKKLLIKK